MIKELYNRLGRIEKLLEDTHFKEVVYLDADQAAEFIKMKKSTIYQLVHKRKIPHNKTGKNLLFNKAELVRWIENSKKDSLENLAEKVNLKNIVEKYKGKDNGLEKWKN